MKVGHQTEKKLTGRDGLTQPPCQLMFTIVG